MTLMKAARTTATAAAPRVSFWSQLGAEPRPLLLYFVIVLGLGASAICGVAYALNWDFMWGIGGFVWLVWLACLFVIADRRTDRFLQRHIDWLRRGAFGVFASLAVLGLVEIVGLEFFRTSFTHADSASGNFVLLMDAMNHGLSYNDGTALVHQAAENLLAGKNPYANANIVTALQRFHGSYDRVTPLRVGRFAGTIKYPTQAELKALWEESVLQPESPPAELVSRVAYPAGSFLLPLPFIAAGVPDLRVVYLLAVVGGLACVAWRLPAKRRLIFAGAVIISLELWNSVMDGETGSLAFPFLLLGWVLLDTKLWVSAVFMGLAMASKQTAWFFLPFYLILVYRTTGFRDLLRATAAVGGVFLVLNLPFIIMDPGLWFASVLSPMTDQTFPLGVGLITVVTSGLVNIASPLPFTVLEALAMAAALVWYYRNCRSNPYVAPVLALTPLFFAWRSLWAYFYYVDIILLAMILMEHPAREQAGLQAAASRSVPS
jgi:hypothetical protein